MKKLFSIFMLFAVFFIFSSSTVASDSGPPANIGEELLLEHNSFTGMLDNNEIDIGMPMVIVCYPEMYSGTIRADKCYLSGLKAQHEAVFRAEYIKQKLLSAKKITHSFLTRRPRDGL